MKTNEVFSSENFSSQTYLQECVEKKPKPKNVLS